MVSKHSDADAKRILEAEKPFRQTLSQPGLRVTKNHYFGIKEWPEQIGRDTPAGIVFANLNLCFKNSGNVSEGSIEDIIWGFRQSGIPNQITFKGFKELKELGFMDFTDELGVVIVGEPSAQRVDSIWYKWSNKFYQNLLDKPEKEPTAMDTNINAVDTTVDALED